MGNKRRILPLWTKPPKISPIKQPLLNQNKANCFNSLSACSQICFKPMNVPKPNTQTPAIRPSRCGINAIPDRPARDIANVCCIFLPTSYASRTSVSLSAEPRYVQQAPQYQLSSSFLFLLMHTQQQYRKSELEP